MKRITFFSLLLVAMLLLTGAALAQDMSEGESRLSIPIRRS